jgi:hypothetical protein
LSIDIFYRRHFFLLRRLVGESLQAQTCLEINNDMDQGPIWSQINEKEANISWCQ